MGIKKTNQSIRSCFIIDDDIEDRSLLIETINEFNDTINCYGSGNGLHAVAMLKAWLPEKPDLIFLDLNMPQLGGSAVVDLMKENESYRDIPIVIYTTSTDPSERELLINKGVAHFASKPTSMQELRDLVTNIFNKYQLQVSA